MIARKITAIAVASSLLAVVAAHALIGSKAGSPAATVRVDQETCDRILPGMTVAEVEEIIGGPAGWYDGITGYHSVDPVKRKGSFPRWVARTGEIVLDQDKDGRVTGARYYPVTVL